MSEVHYSNNGCVRAVCVNIPLTAPGLSQRVRYTLMLPSKQSEVEHTPVQKRSRLSVHNHIRSKGMRLFHMPLTLRCLHRLTVNTSNIQRGLWWWNITKVFGKCCWNVPVSPPKLDPTTGSSQVPVTLICRRVRWYEHSNHAKPSHPSLTWRSRKQGLTNASDMPSNSFIN